MNGRKLFRRIAGWTALILVLLAFSAGIYIYKYIFTPNVIGAKEKPFLYIPTGSGFEDVVNILEKRNLLINEKTFRWTAHRMKYDIHVKPGKYEIKPKMTNKELISLLRSGKQVPVKVTFNNIRTLDQLAQRIEDQIEAKKKSILNLLSDSDYTARLGFTPQNVLSMFLPNTYEFYWNTSADKFLQRMKKEYDRYWTANKLGLARRINFTPVQVSIIASIVQMETNRDDEKPLIAGVYINRYRKNWKLEADPTLVYALGDFTISRVLSVYKEIESPYNTYKYKGLPPGPICLPTIASLNSVLNFVTHKYMYFCAKDDFSGHHAFASTYEQHLLNARRFQKALDRRGIRQ